MLHEHDQGRAFVRVLRERSEQAGTWTDADRQEIADVARGYSAVLHAHIHKEDAVLYPMAEQHLSPERMERVAQDCARYEAAREGTHEKLHAVGEELVARHGPATHPEPQGPGGHGFGCCG
jgi:hemerythrin-like domain-containing protein